jgi:hypothetical protein
VTTRRRSRIIHRSLHRYVCTLCIGAVFCAGCYSSSQKLTCHVPPMLLRCPLALDEIMKQAEVRQLWLEQV